MVPDDKKLRRLIAVAKMYYKENTLQSEIAKSIGVSRPMVSKLLAEAKEFGVVAITINKAGNAQEILAERLAERFSLARVFVIPSRGFTPRNVNGAVAQRAFS